MKRKRSLVALLLTMMLCEILIGGCGNADPGTIDTKTVLADQKTKNEPDVSTKRSNSGKDKYDGFVNHGNPMDKNIQEKIKQKHDRN